MSHATIVARKVTWHLHAQNLEIKLPVVEAVAVEEDVEVVMALEVAAAVAVAEKGVDRVVPDEAPLYSINAHHQAMENLRLKPLRAPYGNGAPGVDLGGRGLEPTRPLSIAFVIRMLTHREQSHPTMVFRCLICLHVLRSSAPLRRMKILILIAPSSQLRQHPSLINFITLYALKFNTIKPS